MEDVFLDDRAVQIIRAIIQRDLRQLQPHPNPVRGDVIEVIEVNPAHRDRAQRVEARRRSVHGYFVVFGLIR